MEKLNNGEVSSKISLNTPFKRTAYLDYLRIVAMFAVVVIHTSASNWHVVSIHSADWMVMTIYDCICRWAVPVFVMVSGTLFLDNSKPFFIQRLFSKNLLRLATAFIFWSVMYAVATYLFGEGESKSITGFIGSIISGHFHMWFIFMLFGLYLLVPVLRAVTASLKLTKYFLVITVVLSMVIPTVLDFVLVVDKLGIIDCNLLEMLSVPVSNAHLAFGFVPYFVGGYYLSKTSLTKKHRIAIYVLGILGFLMTTFLTVYVSLLDGEANELFCNSMNVGVMFMAVAAFVFAKYTVKEGWKFNQFVGRASKCCFGIYLVHIFVMRVLSMFGLSAIAFNPIISIPITAAVTFFISTAISWIMNRIPIVKKYIV